MNRVLFLFVFLSGAAHALVFSEWNFTYEKPGLQSNLTVSLLSGVWQPSQTESKNNPEPISSHKKLLASSNTTSVWKIKRIKHKQTQSKGSNLNTSISSIAQPASNMASGKILAKEIQKLLIAKFLYPPLAQKHGQQGRVTVNVRIDASGTIGDTQIIRSSGFRSLDLAAQKSIRDIGKAPQLQQWLRGRSASINVPVSYRLIET